MQTAINRREFFKSLGLVLVFIGMQFNTAIRNAIPGIDLTVMIMTLSAILLININGLTRIRLTIQMFVLFAFQIILLLFCIFSRTGTTQLLTFHIYLIVLMISFCSNDVYIEFKYFGRLLFYISGFIAIVILYQATDGFTQLKVSYEETSKLWLKQGGDPITMSRALAINMISVLFCKDKNKFEKLLSILFLGADVIGFLSFNNRSTVLCSLIVFVIWFLKYYNNKFSFKKIIAPIIVVILVFLIVKSVPYFQEKTVALYDSMLNGVGTLFGFDIGNVDASAQSRNQILSRIVGNFFGVNTLSNFIFGMGYNYAYVDRPIFQAFFDLGIIGAVIYAFYLLYIPIKSIFGQLKNDCVYNSAWIFVVYISIQSIADQFLTGLPYYYFLWTPTIFIMFSMINYKRKEVQIY